ncbi:MAG: RNA methyltransferase [Candidatus Methanospirare jalkutatii]|nr:MAG: RNA methyltransferase [Candidatus Methanospirare jalkutatii]UYZ40282.1 MAG: RNA methyltransferase [Candidatus Methanospirare jalkutatii]
MDVRVVLVEPKRDENVGAVARVMKNFGFYSLYIVGDSVGEKAFYVAYHAEDVLEKCKFVRTLEEAIEGSHIVVGTTAKTASEKNVLRNFVEPERLREIVEAKNGILTLVFGREDFGLLNEELRKCDFIVHIPANPAYPVLNLSHAVAVVLYELSKSSRKGKGNVGSVAGSNAVKLASVEEKEKLLAHFREFLERVEAREHRVERTLLVLKRIFGRAGITSREVRTLHGMLRKALRALKD